MTYEPITGFINRAATRTRFSQPPILRQQPIQHAALKHPPRRRDCTRRRAPARRAQHVSRRRGAPRPPPRRHAQRQADAGERQAPERSQPLLQQQDFPRVYATHVPDQVTEHVISEQVVPRTAHRGAGDDRLRPPRPSQGVLPPPGRREDAPADHVARVAICL